MSSVAEVLQTRAAEQPAQTAYVWIDEQLHEEASLTYGELHARALAVAAQLAAQCRPGDRALLVFPPGLDFIVAYFACLYARVIAVPVNPPRRQAVQGATRSVVSDCAPSAVLTLGAFVDFMKPALEPVCGELRWLAVDEVANEDTGFEPQPCPADAVAFLQYTSGSTSDAQGRDGHARQPRGQRGDASAAGSATTATRRSVGWLPLLPRHGPDRQRPAAALRAGRPVSSCRRSRSCAGPLAWLRRSPATAPHTSGGPNFAYELCVARAAGGQTCRRPRPELLEDGVQRGRAGPRRHAARLRRDVRAVRASAEQAFYPCYGMAEATLIVTGEREGPRAADRRGRSRCARARALRRGAGRRPPDARRVRARPARRQLVAIVDPETGQPSAADEIGEIWVGGPSVAQGYWGRPMRRPTCSAPPRRASAGRVPAHRRPRHRSSTARCTSPAG